MLKSDCVASMARHYGLDDRGCLRRDMQGTGRSHGAPPSDFGEVPEMLEVQTQDPFIVYTSNSFAILGLRALYFALAAMIERLRYLKYALAAVLIFIGGKILLVNVFGKMPAWILLAVTVDLLAAGVVYSLYRTRNGPAATRLLPRY
jgi:Integral membrane protein TerC family